MNKIHSKWNQFGSQIHELSKNLNIYNKKKMLNFNEKGLEFTKTRGDLLKE